MAAPVNGDGHHVLPRFRAELELGQAEVLARELDRAITKRRASQPQRAHDPVDQARLRGIPAIGGRGSCGGAIAGTRPDFEVLKLDKKLRERRRRKL